MFRDKINPANTYSPVTHVTAGGIAGAVAAAVTTPLDVCKTLLQTRGLSSEAQIRNARGLADAFRIIYQRQGLMGFTRGLTPRVLTNVPSNALCCEFSAFISPRRSQLPNAVLLRLIQRSLAGLSYEGFRFFLKGGHNKPPPPSAVAKGL